MLEYFQNDLQLEAFIKGLEIRNKIDSKRGVAFEEEEPKEEVTEETVEMPPHIGFARMRWVKTVTAHKKHRKHRRKISDEVRLEVMTRDGFKCVECGSREELQIHHIKYRSKGGTDEPDNLVCLCVRCHYRRHKDEPVGKIMKKRIDRL